MAAAIERITYAPDMQDISVERNEVHLVQLKEYLI
jgi:hypothetical protein